MRRLSILLLLVMVGCHTRPTAPALPRCAVNTGQLPPRCAVKTGKRPQDMTDRILGSDKYPDWLKRNYAEWIRYAYDREVPPGRR